MRSIRYLIKMEMDREYDVVYEHSFTEDFEIGKCRACKKISPLNAGICDTCNQYMIDDEEDEEYEN